MNENRPLHWRDPAKGTAPIVMLGVIVAFVPIAVAVFGSFSDAARAGADGGVFLGALRPMYWAFLSAVPSGAVAMLLGGTALAKRNYFGLAPLLFGLLEVAVGAPSFISWAIGEP